MSYVGTIKGTIFWQYLRTVHPESKKYQVTLGKLDDATVAELKAAGGNVIKRQGEEGNCIILKTDFLPDVVDAKGNPIPDSIIKKIGNGSTGVVKLVIKPSKYKYKTQGLNGVQLLNLVEYKPKPKFDVAEGYTVTEEQLETVSDEGVREWEDAQVDE